MKRIKQATKIINASDVYTKDNFIRIKGVNHNYSLYNVTEADETNESAIILRQISIVRQLINEAVLTHLNNGKIKVEFNQYTF